MMSDRQSLSALYPRQYDVPLLMLLAAAGLATGLFLPLFNVTQMVFWRSSYSVVTGVINLFRQHEYFLAAIIFVFSVIFPIVKLLALSRVWFRPLTTAQRTTGLHWLGFLGKWSMLDVLILALTIVIVKLKPLADVEPRSGVYVFCIAIFLSMVATTRIESLARRRLNATC